MAALTDEDREQARVFAIDRAMLELQMFRSNPERYKNASITFVNDIATEGGLTISLAWDKQKIKLTPTAADGGGG